jgi:GntR family transcriptional regulator, transcriptional repressor for pyruvate dehydrogenase complex
MVYLGGTVVRPISSDDFGSVSRDALPDQIAAKLIELVRDQRLRSGDRLPPERELAAAMGVSRSSLREALRALSMIGVVDMRHGDGTYLSSLEPASLMRSVGLVLELSETGMEELFEARKLVEPGLAALAAQRIDTSMLMALQHCVEASEESVGDHERFMRADLQLHDLIARAAGNAILSRLIDSIHALGIASRRSTTGLPGVEQQTVKDHREIVDAVARRDPHRAHRAMLTHLENVERARTA